MKKLILVSLSLLAMFLASILSGCSSRDGNLPFNDLPQGWHESSIEVDGLQRWYRVYQPDSLGEQPAMVLYLHGGTLSMRSIARRTAGGTREWIDLADGEGFILLAPNGVNPKSGDTYGNDQNWNDVRPDTASGQTGVDDTAFLLRLLDLMVSEYGVDPNRIYVTGASNGGLMTYRLMIEAPERFAAGAAFIANLPDPTAGIPFPDHPAPLLIANGTEDPLMPWDGGVIARNRGFVVSSLETVSWWVEANQADRDRMISRDLPDSDPDDGCLVREDYYPARKGGAPVVFYTLLGGGHTMPSSIHHGLDNWLTRRLVGPVCRDLEGARLAWDFFQDAGNLDRRE